MEPTDSPDPRPGHRRRTGVLIGLGVVLIIAAMVGLYLRAASRINHTALSQSPRPVATTGVESAEFQPLREYVGMTDAWNEARIGPQYVAAYVADVLYRPGAKIRRGEVLAKLDCRFTSAASREIAARGRAVAKRQVAAGDEAQRVQEIAKGGFASKNEVEQLRAKASAESAEVEGLQASLSSKQIEVDDCILRAPFDGEVVDRFVDPGAYVRPGEAVLTAADRSTIRVIADAPEDDYAIVAPGTPVEITVEATHVKLTAPISRRTPATDRSTRTVHFEIDVDNQQDLLPVGVTARVQIAVGKPVRASRVTLQAATLREKTASLFVVTDNVAHRKEVKVIGQRQGELYLDPSLAPGTQVVLEGRALLSEGDRVTAGAPGGAR